MGVMAKLTVDNRAWLQSHSNFRKFIWFVMGSLLPGFGVIAIDARVGVQ
jgi:hypothetical protein